MDDTYTNDTSQLSELDSVRFSRSGSPNSAAATEASYEGRGSNKRTQTATETWSHAKKIKPEDEQRDRWGNKIWNCGRCAWSSGAITSVRNHLRVKHGIKIKAQQPKARVQGQKKLQEIFHQLGQKEQERADKREQEALKKAINQPAFDESLLQLIVNNNIPHSMAEYPELYSMIMNVNYMAEDVLPKSRAMIPKKLNASFIRTKDEIKEHLSTALSEIHLACDVWTTQYKKKAFLAVVAHLVDSKAKPRKALLGLPRLRGSHGGQHQAEHVNKIIDWYEIGHKLGFYVGDNHGSNDKCCRFISRHLREQYQIKWDPQTRRIRCHGHVINLASQAFIFAPDKATIDKIIAEISEEAEEEYNSDEEVEDSDDTYDATAKLARASKKKACWRDIGPLGKLHAIIAYMRSSELLYDEFHELAGRVVPLDNDTRWDSWYSMNEVANKLDGPIDTFIRNHWKAVGKYALTPDDWETLREINTFLKPFEKVTRRTQGDLDSIEKTLYTMDILVKHFEKQKNKHVNNPEFQNAILMAWYAFDKYYLLTDQVPAYAAALLLHPSRRRRYIDANWKKSWIKSVLPELHQLWEEKYANLDLSETTTSTSHRTYEPDEYELIERDLDVVGHTADIWESFIEASPTEISTTALEWWCEEKQRKRYPRLSRMAIDILSVPAMSAEAERIFSGARRQIPWSRAQLGEKTIEHMECLKHWQRKGWLHQLNVDIPYEGEYDCGSKVSSKSHGFELW